jgi:glycosyltransferase involved in cell wall biosynthesis
MSNFDVNLCQPRVDILVVVFNHEKTIIKCLKSILNQSYSNLFISVIDDCSTDNSWNLISELQREFPAKITANQTPFNVGSLQLIEYCNFHPLGDFWGVIDGDDWWLAEDKISLQVTKLLSNPRYVGISGTTVVLDRSQNIVYEIKPSLEIWNYLDYLLKVDNLYVHGSSILWRNIFMKKGNFFPRLMKNGWPLGEWPLTLATLSESGKWLFHINKALSVYNYSGSGMWSSQIDSAQLENNRKLALRIWAETPFWQKVLTHIVKLGWRTLGDNLLLITSSFLNFIQFIGKELKAFSISTKS